VCDSQAARQEAVCAVVAYTTSSRPRVNGRHPHVPEGKGVEAPALTQLVEGVQVGIQMVGVVTECSVVLAGPVLWEWGGGGGGGGRLGEMMWGV
jgi:hypothetical protein